MTTEQKIKRHILTRQELNDPEYMEAYVDSMHDSFDECIKYQDELKHRIAILDRILEGVPEGAFDGGWTARGIMKHTADLEREIEVLRKRVEIYENTASLVKPERKNF